MKQYFLSLLVMLIAWNLQAHNPDISSTMLVEKEDNKWIIQIRSALTGFDYVIKEQYPAYETPEEFQALVLKHLKKNIQISFNGGKIATLKNGGVKLGHETIAVFEVEGVPATINSVSVTNTSFGTISRNQNTLVVLKEGFKKNRYKLDNKNQHTMELKVDGAQFIPVNGKTAALSADASTSYSYGGIAISLLGLFFVFFLYTKFRA